MDKNTAITIGDFDGVHRGHQAIFSKMKTLSEYTVVITFNHPRKTIYSQEYKKRLLKKLNIDAIFTLDFTPEFSQQTYQEFLKKLMPFDYLVLGENARLGYQRNGTPDKIKEIAQKLNFSAEYVPLINSISSTAIRLHIQKGNLKEASEMLGRPYSIYSKVHKGSGIGRSLGFPTANIDVSNLCLPPLGVYNVTLIHKEQNYKALANIGYAPTIRQDNKVSCEIHIPNIEIDLYDQDIEVLFNKFIRSEKHFENTEQLRDQISQDKKVL